jgi:hypothetical protein
MSSDSTDKTCADKLKKLSIEGVSNVECGASSWTGAEYWASALNQYYAAPPLLQFLTPSSSLTAFKESRSIEVLVLG